MSDIGSLLSEDRKRESDAAFTDRLLDVVLRPPSLLTLGFLVTGGLTAVLFAAIAYTVTTGIGTWGNDVPVGWGVGITNFVWWIGIGHAGTFISAFLLLLEQKWRTSINRFAEGMTLFAVVQAGLFPVLHLGRPWFFYWLVPYPSTMGVWPQFRSSLPWDVAAIGTYLIVSFLFWYLGLVPDLAVVRDRAGGTWKRRVYGVLALGWYGSAEQWSRWRVAYGLLAGLATPLVVSVHSIVSCDFAIALLPGWHATHFPPYFVAGAIYSGFAMVITLLVPARRLYRLHGVVTEKHLDNLAKMLLGMGWIVLYSYVVEMFVAWYSGDPFERYTHLVDRPLGASSVLFWTVIVCNCVVVQAVWSPRVRKSPVALWLVSVVVQIGMWLERYVLIVGSQRRGFLPSSWGDFTPSLVDAALFVGSLGFFGFLFLLFLRFVPFVPISELKELKHEAAHEPS